MILHGDELGRTQDGNNNTYAQDSEIAWMDWVDVDQPLMEFTAALVRLRRDHPTFRRKRFFTGGEVRIGEPGEERLNDIVWLHLDGRPMEDGDWDGGVAGDRHVPQRQRHRRQGRARRHASPTTTSCSTSTPTARPTSTLPPEEYAEAWDVIVNTGGSADAAADLPGRLDVPPREHQRAGAAPAPRARGRARPLGRGVGGGADPERLSRGRRRDGPDQHLPAAGPGVVRPATRPRGGCPTCATSASTGSTSRRCSRPSPAPTTATTSCATTGSTRRAAAARASTPSRPRRGGSGSACSSTSCPTTSASRRPSVNAWWWDLLDHGRASRYAEAFDVDWDFGDGRVRVPVVGDGDEGSVAARPRRRALPRPPLPGRRRLTSWSRGARPTTGSTGAGSSRSTPSPASASRSRWVFDESHVEIGRWFAEGLVDGLRVDHPDGLRAPRGLPARPRRR